MAACRAWSSWGSQAPPCARARARVRWAGSVSSAHRSAQTSGYDPIALADGLAADRAQLLVRIKGDRVFYGDRHPGHLASGAGPGITGPGSTARSAPPGARRATQLTTCDRAY